MSDTHSMGAARWGLQRLGVLVAALGYCAPGAAAMNPAECANLDAMLGKGPSFKAVQTRVTADTAFGQTRDVVGHVAPFQRCTVSDSIAGVTLSCGLEVPLEGAGAIDKPANTFLRGEFIRMARDLAECLEQKLPEVDLHKRLARDAADDERFGWSFVVPARRAGPGDVVGTTLSVRIPAAGAAPRPSMALAFDAEFQYVRRDESRQWLQGARRAWADASSLRDPPTAPETAAAPIRPADLRAALTNVVGLRRGDTVERATVLFGAPDKTDPLADTNLSTAYWFDGGLSVTFERGSRRIAMVHVRDAAAVAALRRANVEVGFPYTLVGSPAGAVEHALGVPSQVRNSFYRWRYPVPGVFQFRVFCLQSGGCENFHVHWER